MSVESAPPPTSLVRHVVLALACAVGTDEQNGLGDAPTRRRALMYAEAFDDADEPDALFRFGPKLHACLSSLGLDLSDHLAARSGRSVGGTSLAA